MDGWWSEFENDVVKCLASNGTMAPADLGQRIGLSEESTISLLAMLAREGRVRIRLVEAVPSGPSSKRSRAA